MRLFDSENPLVSCFPSIAWKRETKGNETGNGEETKAIPYGKTGNGPFWRGGNEGRKNKGLRFHWFSRSQSIGRVLP